MKRKVKLFLNYANEDLGRVDALYAKLKSEGFEPWMAKRDILPGEKWEYAIIKAVHQADFIIICISENSVNKRGYVQKEIREALELWNQKLEDDIFLIPVRLDEVQVPQALASFQRVDLGKEDGFKRLCAAIQAGAMRKQSPNVLAKADEMNILPHKFSESLDGPPKYSIDFEYPSFQGLGGTSSNEINLRLEAFALEQVHKLRVHRPDTIVGRLSSSENVASNAFDLYGGYNITLLTSNLVSIKFLVGTYEAGWAHPFSWVKTYNFLLNPLVQLSLDDLLNHEEKYLTIISNYCISDLVKQAEGHEPTDLIQSGAGHKWENFKEFNLTKDSLVISFQDYAVGSHAWGLRQVTIPLLHLKQTFSKDCNLFAVING